MSRTTRRRCELAAGLLLAALVAAAAADDKAAADPAPLKVCMADDNPPLSHRAAAGFDGLDVRIARALAAELHRPLAIVPFESKHEAESTLSQEVNALLSSGVCEVATGFALLVTDLGPPGRPTARVPDFPGAPRRSQRPWVALGTLLPSRAYQAMAMGLVVRDAALASATLASLADAAETRIGVVSGTLAGTAVALYRSGRLQARIVSVARNQDVLAELEAGRFDVALVPLARFDAWKLAHPRTALQRAAYVHPLRINIGLVVRSEAAALVEAADRVIARALGNGDLARWAADTGTTPVAPVEPQVGRPAGMMELLRE